MADEGLAPGSGVQIRWYALVQFIAQLAVLAIGCYSSWQLGGGLWAGALATAAFAVLYATMWVRWLAAGSRRRLSFRGRLVVVLASGALVVVLAGLAGVLLTAVVAVSIIILCDALDQRWSGDAADGLQ